MYGHEIEQVLKNDSYTKDKYRGIYSVESLPQQMRKESLYVLYLQASKEKAEQELGHWTLIWNHGTAIKSTFFFDSFGNPPPMSICDRLLSVSQIIEYSDIQFQNILSVTCGQYVCLQALLLARGYTPFQVLSHFQQLKTRGLFILDAYVKIIISSLHELTDAPILHPDIFLSSKL